MWPAPGSKLALTGLAERCRAAFRPTRVEAENRSHVAERRPNLKTVNLLDSLDSQIHSEGSQPAIRTFDLGRVKQLLSGSSEPRYVRIKHRPMVTGQGTILAVLVDA